MNNQLIRKTLRFLQENPKKHCVVATVGKSGKPECAVMGYVVKNNLNLICMTDSRSRKWENMKDNPFVAVTIGWKINKPFLQCEGIVKLIENGNKIYSEYEKLYCLNHPHSLQYKRLATSVFYQIKPTWIRFVDLSVFPSKIEETNL